MSRPSTPTLELVQVFRGAAAILVMLYHVGMVNHFHFPFAGDVFKWGYSGIDFFFILSGFIMLFVHQDRAGDAGYTWRFLMLRAVRIFPIYWCVLALTVVLVWMCPPLPANQWAPASTLTLPTLTRAVFLYEQQQNAIVSVAWTLSYELVFYAFFATYFLAGAGLFTALSIVWCGLVALQWTGVVYLGAYPVLLRPVILEFFLGCLAAVLVKRVAPRRVSAWWIVLAVIGVCAAAGAEISGVVTGYTWWAAPYFLLIVTGAAYDRATARRYPRLLVLLGEASYAIYLVHYGMVVLFAQTIDLYRPLASKAPNVTLTLLAVAILMVGILVHLGVERPLLTAARRRLER